MSQGCITLSMVEEKLAYLKAADYARLVNALTESLLAVEARLASAKFCRVADSNLLHYRLPAILEGLDRLIDEHAVATAATTEDARRLVRLLDAARGRANEEKALRCDAEKRLADAEARLNAVRAAVEG